MRQHVARGGLCYEPFSGSGSQIMAGEANGRRVFAMVDVAVERWQAETGRAAVLDADGRSFAEVQEERIGTAPAESAGQDVATEALREMHRGAGRGRRSCRWSRRSRTW